MLLTWSVIFILSLGLLVKSADWFVENAERIGLAFKMSPFVVGVTIVALGTSFPELISSLFAVFKGASEIVIANALGSNIANILLIVGFAAVVARNLTIKRSLIDLDAPLLAVTTVLFVFIMLDRQIVFGEGVLLLIAFLIYFLYTIFQKRGSEKEEAEIVEVLPSRIERRSKKIRKKEMGGEVALSFGTFFFCFSV